jgi:asparagine synthase (glutamine-hydrolysing)
MCGITGTVNERDPGVLAGMLQALAHRGPDDVGTYRDDETGIMLGHRRLSIIDLSSAGHQPMSDESGSVWVVFNGEIYNYKELAAELKGKGYSFRSSSDTEVLVHGYREWGRELFRRIDGMWALALYDKKAGELILSRDSAGMKPLYYYRGNGRLYFASELNALSPLLPASARREPRALKRFLAHGYIYGEGTVYEGIRAVPPATALVVSLADLSFSPLRTYEAPRKSSWRGGMPEAVREFERLFADSVAATLQADVPVGLFLSGGIDSSIVGRTLRAQGARLQAFTVGFEGTPFDEGAAAVRIAKALDFPHTKVEMRAADIAEDIGDIFDAFGQPFADTSMLPTYYVSKHAREAGYKVALTGDGADELFGGYPTHFLPALTRLYRKLPRATDSLVRAAARGLPENFTKLGHKEKLSRFLHGARAPYAAAHASWKHVFSDAELERLILPARGDVLTQDATFDEYFTDESGNETAAVMRADFETFLTYDCLVKSDIASMRHGMELRMPFLNKALLDFAESLPTHLKVSPLRTKKLLRAALSRDLPRTIVQAKKQGFTPPLARWLSDELRPVMLDLLCEDAVANTGLLDYTYVASLMEEHLARRHDHTRKLWALMSLTRFYSRHDI